jgi:hypothetical protein
MRRARLCIAPLLLAGCALTPPPHGRMQGALPLEWERPHVDTLNCKRGDCERWFRAEVTGPGYLSVDVRALPATGQESPPFAVGLASEARDVARAASEGRPAVQLESRVTPGGHLVSIVAAPDTRELDFSVRLHFRPAPPRPPPPPTRPPPPPRAEEPRPKIHRSAVLETEGSGSDLALLIESGERHGMRAGMRGRVLDAAGEIGTVVIEQVYPDGSRARVEAPLRREVTHETVVEIEVPAGLLESAPDAHDREQR